MHLALDEVRDNLGVSFSDEAMAFLLELALQIEIVLDDAVVDDDDLAGAVAVWMCVFFRRASVRRPACVPDAVIAVERVDRERIFEARKLAGATPQLDRAVANHGDAGRVVAAVLEAPQAVDEDRENLLAADIADDSAHTSVASR